MAPPFKAAEFDMDVNGISREGDVVDIGVEKGVIEKSGSFFKYNGEVLAQGREAAKQRLIEDHPLCKEIEKKIWESIQNSEEAAKK